MANLTIQGGIFAKLTSTEPMKVIIPVFKNCVSASVVGMMDMLTLTENFYHHLPLQKKKWFRIELVSITENKKVNK